MKPVFEFQPYGDFLPAAIASILELPLESVPTVTLPVEKFREAVKHLSREEREAEAWRIWNQYRPIFEAEQCRAWDEWLKARGLVMMILPADFKFPGWSVLVGHVGKHNHCVVALNGEKVYDPDADPPAEPEPFVTDKIIVIAPADPSLLIRANGRPEPLQ